MASDNSNRKERKCKDFVVSIPPDLPPAISAMSPKCCIYRVPKQLRNVNEKAYTPKLVSIGPFHHNGDGLKDMEMQKLIYFEKFLNRTEKSQEDLLKIIIDNEKKISHCYSEEFHKLNGKKFVQMILLDAIFIIELFWRNENDPNDYISSKPWLAAGIQHDLILLENQLPFFVFEKLYMFAANDSSSCNHRKEGMPINKHKEELKRQDAPFVNLSRNYFCDYDQRHRSRSDEEVPKKPIGEEVNHFTDLLRYSLCSSVPNLSPDQKPWDTRYCAKELDSAGLKFKVAEERTLLDIQFHQNCSQCFDCSCLLSCLPCCKRFPFLESMQCILEVPCFQIDDDTETVFRNLMALEQWHYSKNAYICNYVLLLDRLINTKEDVDLLVKEKVIVNMLGSNDVVAKLINQLCDYIITEPPSCYSDIAQKLNKHYDKALNQILATITREYFPNIFRGTATIVGLIVLGFTLWSFIRPFVDE